MKWDLMMVIVEYYQTGLLYARLIDDRYVLVCRNQAKRQRLILAFVPFEEQEREIHRHGAEMLAEWMERWFPGDLHGINQILPAVPIYVLIKPCSSQS